MRSNDRLLIGVGGHVVALDASSGQELWRKTPKDSAELFEALGPELPRQDWRTNWRTTAFTRAGDEALYLSGPTISRLLAVSSADGKPRSAFAAAR